VILRYRSGEEIRKGDHVLFHREPAQIELVASDLDDPETRWEMQEFGGGILIREPRDANPTFIRADSISEYEDLEFVSRAKDSSKC
jgi:hypothetical protein